MLRSEKYPPTPRELRNVVSRVRFTSMYRAARNVGGLAPAEALAETIRRLKPAPTSRNAHV